MKKFLVLVFSAFLISSCDNILDYSRIFSQFEVTGTEYDFGEPSAKETLALEYINRARSAPTGEGLWLSNMGAGGDASVTSAVSYFSVNLSSMATAFTTYEARPPLAFNKQLLEAAETTCQMMITYNTQMHTINGVSPWDRITDTGYTYSGASENIYWKSKNVLYGHAGFQIDWGYGTDGMQEPPGHRLNIMDVSNRGYLEIGIGIIEHHTDSYDYEATAHSIASPLGSSYFYLCGVVYDDADEDDFYDIGEGQGGVTVSIEDGEFYAVTAASGAYVIPFDPDSGGGMRRVQALGGSFSPIVSLVYLTNENYKLDFDAHDSVTISDPSIGYSSMSESRTVSEVEDDTIHFLPE